MNLVTNSRFFQDFEKARFSELLAATKKSDTMTVGKRLSLTDSLLDKLATLPDDEAKEELQIARTILSASKLTKMKYILRLTEQHFKTVEQWFPEDERLAFGALLAGTRA